MAVEEKAANGLVHGSSSYSSSIVWAENIISTLLTIIYDKIF